MSTIKVTVENYQGLALVTEAEPLCVLSRIFPGRQLAVEVEDLLVPDHIADQVRGKIRLLHAEQGLASEWHELNAELQVHITPSSSVNWWGELSDICWFAAIGCWGLDFPIPSAEVIRAATLVPGETSKDVQALVARLGEVIGEFSTQVKAHFNYGRDVVKGRSPGEADRDMRLVLRDLLYEMFFIVSSIAVLQGKTLEHVLQANIDKLEARYGEKYDAYRAENRDLERETAAVAPHVQP